MKLRTLVCIQKGMRLRMFIFFYIPIILFVYKEIYFNTNKLNPCIPSVCASLLLDHMDIFLMRFLVDMPSRLSS